jgi:hypothetical protein
MKRNERASADAGFGVLSAVAHHLCGTIEHNCFIPGAVGVVANWDEILNNT